jgi:hypothetical protein
VFGCPWVNGTTGRPRKWAKKTSVFLTSPLGLLLLGTLLASILIPRWSAIWQDRQPELALKSSLVDRVAKSTSETVLGAKALRKRNGIRRGGDAQFDTLDNGWKVTRAQLIAVVSAYFSADVVKCWSKFSDEISKYISLGRPFKKPNHAPLLKEQVGHPRKDCHALKDAPISLQRRRDDLRRGLLPKWTTFERADNDKFQDRYQDLGELLLIDSNRIVLTMVASHARGFTHGWWIFG